MKRVILTISAMLTIGFSFAQCPDLRYALVNSCGPTEGNNEFVVFTTKKTAPVSVFKLIYGNANPPVTSGANIRILSGRDAINKTGTGTITSGSSCSLTQVTNPTTSIPANSRVIFLPSIFDANYDVSALCESGSPLYVVYINTTAGSALSSIWTANGTMANSPNTDRYLQILDTTQALCILDPQVKSYSNSWPTNTDGNAVTWNENSNTASYSNYGCSNIALPVSLLDVSAYHAKNMNTVNWRTSQEINTESFIIEKSYDGKNFSPVSSVPATGNSSTVRSYQFNDQSVEYRPTYYRIKSVDKSGEYSISKVVRILPAKASLSVSNIYPNPATNQIFVEWSSALRKSSVLKIMDVTGRVLISENIQSNNGFNKRAMNVSNLPHGKYIIQIVSDQNIVTDSFSK